MSVEFKCKEIVVMNIEDLVPHPANDRIHPPSEELILALMEIFVSDQGFNTPLKIDSKDNMIASGHARVEALKRLAEKTVPCIPIDYKNKSLMYADIVADNELVKWRVMNHEEIKLDLKKMPELDLKLIGIKDFDPEPIKIIPKQKDVSFQATEKECPSCGYKW